MLAFAQDPPRVLSSKGRPPSGAIRRTNPDVARRSFRSATVRTADRSGRVKARTAQGDGHTRRACLSSPPLPSTTSAPPQPLSACSLTRSLARLPACPRGSLRSLSDPLTRTCGRSLRAPTRLRIFPRHPDRGPSAPSLAACLPAVARPPSIAGRRDGRYGEPHGSSVADLVIAVHPPQPYQSLTGPTRCPPRPVTLPPSFRGGLRRSSTRPRLSLPRPCCPPRLSTPVQLPLSPS